MRDIQTPVLWLQEAGYSAYFVGNVSREKLLGLPHSHEADIATSALPGEVVSILRHNNIIPSYVDEKFGVVSFNYDGVHFEATTFRQDIYRTNLELIKRYPDEIKFVKLLALDSKRRDLTVNSIYLNPKTGKFLDYEGGQEDFKNKIIRVVGDPEVRFKEDPIRILRAIRFKYLLGFRYEPKTQEQIKALASWVNKLSPGVVKKELSKLRELPHFTIVKDELDALGIIQDL